MQLQVRPHLCLYKYKCDGGMVCTLIVPLLFLKGTVETSDRGGGIGPRVRGPRIVVGAAVYLCRFSAVGFRVLLAVTGPKARH